MILILFTYDKEQHIVFCRPQILYTETFSEQIMIKLSGKVIIITEARTD